MVGQGGSNGVIQALKDAGHPWVPIAGESENGFRKAIAEHSADGLKGISIGQSPGLVAIAMKAAISALEGNVMPQLISVPLPVATYDHSRTGRTTGPTFRTTSSHRERIPALRCQHLRSGHHGPDGGRRRELTS